MTIKEDWPVLAWMKCTWFIVLATSTLACSRVQDPIPKKSPLIKRLVADSKDKLPLMRSANFSEALLEGQLSREEQQSAFDYITNHKDYSSYHVLFLLRQLAGDKYKQVPMAVRSAILVSALEHIDSLNDWGYLHPIKSYDDIAAQALLETKEEATAQLTHLLNNRGKAPLVGSEEATFSSRYKYRRCDFAYRYLSLILGRTPTFCADLQDRDKEIARLKEELAKHER